MLIFAAILVTAALIIVELNQSRGLSLRLAYYGGGYLVALTVAHLITRRFAPYADPVLLPLVALLNGLGLVMIYRLDLAAAVKATANGNEAPALQAPAQLLWTGIALLLFLAVLMIVRDHTLLARYSYTLLLFGLIFLALPGVLPAK